MPASAPTLSPEQLDELQSLLKDWLRLSGRTQSDLRRALRAGSIRMPVLIDELHRTYCREGAAGLAERLCAIEAGWLCEEPGGAADSAGDDGLLQDSMGQLDLLLQEIRADGGA
ncbi:MULTISPECIES: hypothetical protein [Cyanophyceae]|jgi:hypothetical protein|uniref:Uncharacterized protein n=1 Tax=Aphanothece cf. minutissima CCALA 015 TaxID=2107695 RepID=A0ABX5F735_9CHRO|nr:MULTISPECIES: hypothetical protein [Cyanophyceae]MCP9797981.1 hypothetical protein [Cyanobium sp. Lug-B]MCP9932454.1 hypothetical protein [Cyanobium sp. Candia 9D4]PSB37364.1 hypothetical protein C7B81_10520 [Aphanothece cf. minutissima CCALA 015]